jgi:tetratricopeptide (TPR) repeat protein
VRSTPARKAQFKRRVLRFGLAAAALTGVAGVVILFAVRSDDTASVNLDPDLVAVATLANETGDATLEPLGRMAAERIAQAIQQRGVGDVVPPTVSLAAAAEVQAASDRVGAFAQATGAGVVLHGAYYLLGDSLQFQVQITDAVEGTVVSALAPVTGPREPATKALGVVRERVLAGLAAALDFRAGYLYWPIQAPSLEVYRVYRQGFDTYERAASRTEFDEALRYFEEAWALDSTFLLALIMRAEILTSWGTRPDSEGDSLLQVAVGYRERMSEWERLRLQLLLDEDSDARLRTARRLAAVAPRWSYTAGIYAWEVYRPREALEYYARVDTANVNFLNMGWYWRNVLRAHHMLQDYETELELARAAPRDYGSREIGVSSLDLARFLREHQIAALAALGRSNEVAVLLDTVMAQPLSADNTIRDIERAVLELRAHGYRDASLEAAQRMLNWLEARSRGEVGQEEEEVSYPWYLNWRAICLFRLERYEEAIPVLEEIGRDDRPEDFQGVSLADYLSVLLGDHERGRALLERHPRNDYAPGINAVLGDREEAMRLLRERFQEVMQRGNAMYWTHKTQSLESLRGYPPFERFMRPRG